jgi:8-oxo-dGTP pyrophosphatase MutT (NUDIX family)
MIWKPSVTVACVVEQDGRFLLVEEETDAGVRFNQPAGHLDPGEGPAQGAVRETLEETAYSVCPESLVGIYRWHSPANDTTYLRFAFAARVLAYDADRRLDTGILGTHWLSADELRALKPRHRSPLVLRCVEDYLAGRRYPLDLIAEIP